MSDYVYSANTATTRCVSSKKREGVWEREKEQKKGIKDSFKLICLVKRTTESGICKSEKHTPTFL